MAPSSTRHHSATTPVPGHGAAPYLACRRGCGFRSELQPLFTGCPACHAAGRRSALDVRYDYAALRGALDDRFWTIPGDSLWQYGPLLPVPDTAHIVSLGMGNTPLVPSRHLSRRYGLPHLWFKNDCVGPTASHKDRMQTVSVSVAHAFGFRRIVSISTGNFGASLAAHAAAAGLAALVLCPRDVSPLLLRLIRSYGAAVIVSDWGASERFLPQILARGGWFPAVNGDDDPPSNPFGLEGAKTIAYELARQCPDGRVDAVLVPCASGDTLVGIAKGFAELRLLGRSTRVPRLYGCQPSGAPALAQTLTAGLDEVVVLEHPSSIATSTREPTSSDAALAAIRTTGGGAPTATDGEIVAAMQALSGEGLCVEPSGALAVACLPGLLEAGAITADDVVVCLLTSSGVKWPDTLGPGLSTPGPIAPQPEALEAALRERGLA